MRVNAIALELGAFEAAAAGNSVIITGYGGQCDFLPEDIIDLVQYNLVPIDNFSATKSYTSNQKWAKADSQHAGSLLKEYYNNRATTKNKGNVLSTYIHKHFNNALLSETLYKTIIIIWNRHDATK